MGRAGVGGRKAAAVQGCDAAGGGRARQWRASGTMRSADGAPGCGGREGDTAGVGREAAGRGREAAGVPPPGGD